MIDKRHYVPVVLTRRGERGALALLSAGARTALTPLFVVHPRDYDYEHSRYRKTVPEHLQDLPRHLVDAWGVRPALVDVSYVEDHPVGAAGEAPLVWFTAEAAARGLPLVPVVAPSSRPDYRAAAAVVAARDGLGACLRLGPGDWPSAIGQPALDAVLAGLGIGPSDVDLVLDLGGEVGSLAEPAVRAELTGLPHLTSWRSLVVTGTGMPATIPAGRGVHRIPRREWTLYRRLVTGAPALPRVPTFGDYVIASPDPVIDVDPRIMSISASLRYTCDDEWLVPKGELFKGSAGRSRGGAAMLPVAELLRAEAKYRAGHCGLERWVTDMLASPPTGTPGPPEVWRKWGTKHHLELVTEALLLRPATPGGP